MGKRGFSFLHDRKTGLADHAGITRSGDQHVLSLFLARKLPRIRPHDQGRGKIYTDVVIG
jgi:hypothetical protein